MLNFQKIFFLFEDIFLKMPNCDVSRFLRWSSVKRLNFIKNLTKTKNSPRETANEGNFLLTLFTPAKLHYKQNPAYWKIFISDWLFC